jgi:precorrin-6B methylase 2
MTKLEIAAELIADVGKLHKQAFYESGEGSCAVAISLARAYHDLKLVRIAMNQFKEGL